MKNSQLLPITSGHNFRELGGYTNKSGQQLKSHKLIRSATLSTLSTEDLTYLTNYGVKTIVDFRSQDEIDLHPDKVPTGATYDFLPVFTVDETKSSVEANSLYQQLESNPNGFDHMLKVYQNIIEDPHAQKTYQDFFDLLLDQSKPGEGLLFHCTAGKDRTGMGATFLLSALDVDQKTIQADYLLTKTASSKAIANTIDQLKQAGKNDHTLKAVYDVLTVYPEYLQRAYETIDQLAGDMDTYLNDYLKVTPAKKKELKKIYLD